MSNVVYPLFSRHGIVNPIPKPRLSMLFWDSSREIFHLKQSSDFDGGWRWFEKVDTAAIVIYNIKLHPQAHYVLTHMEIENTCNGAEFVLLCAQVRIIVDHNYFNTRDYV